MLATAELEVLRRVMVYLEADEIETDMQQVATVLHELRVACVGLLPKPERGEFYLPSEE